MCITAFKADLLKTITGSWDVNHPVHGFRRVKAYFNIPKDLSESDKANFMVLPIDSKEPLTPENVIDTSKLSTPNPLKELVRQTDPFKNSRGSFKSKGSIVDPPKNYKVEMGVYNIFLINDASQANEILKEDGRDEHDQTFWDFYAKNFPKYPLALCYMKKEIGENVKPSDIMIQYVPMHDNIHCITTMEGHGTLPTIGARDAHYDTVLVLGMDTPINAIKGFNSKRVDKSKFDPEIQDWIPTYAGMQIFRKDNYLVGDLYIDTENQRTKFADYLSLFSEVA